MDHFYGIRYAKAKRFQMPEPVPAWEGVKDAGSYGMELPGAQRAHAHRRGAYPPPVLALLRALPVPEPVDQKLRAGAKRPVLFWIHGGGYASGSGMEQICYDGFNLAKDDDVVVVTVNHRLNAFGYLDLSALGRSIGTSVNVGMADLVEALRWVRTTSPALAATRQRDHLRQSGGGGKVTVLGQIPEAEGLFHR